MPLIEVLLLALRAMTTHRLRAVLTLLGVIIGVSTVVLLTSLIDGSELALAMSSQRATGSDIIDVHPQWGRHWRRVNHSLDLDDASHLATDPALANDQVLPEEDKREWTFDGQRWQALWLRGASPLFLSFYHLNVARGRFLTDLDRQRATQVCVIGPEAARRLKFTPVDRGGSLGEVEAGGQRWQVVGILAHHPGFGGWKSWDDSVLVPDTTWLATVYRSSQRVDAISVRAPGASLDGLTRVAWDVRAVLRAPRGGLENFKVEDPRQKARDNAGMLLAMRVLVVLVATVCLGVGGINLMNIMLVAVAERKREIGLRKALGATEQDIRRQFLLEAICLGAGGGVLGLLWGAALGGLASWILARIVGFWPYQVDLFWAGLSCLAAVAIGACFGYFPARRAAALDAVECLRQS